METAESRTRRLVLALAVAFIAMVPFLPALRGGWIYDDHQLVAGNPYIHHLHWFPRWFTTTFWNTDGHGGGVGTHVNYWRPLITVTYALDWQLGHSPLVFHLTNELLQGATAALAFLVLRRWVGATWPAFVAAVLFAVHPTKAESVAWISGRTDVTCTLCLLLASEGIGRRLAGARASLAGRGDRPAGRGLNARGGLALEIAGTIGAYLAKEQAVVVPAFVVVETWVALGRPALDLGTVKRLLRAALPQLGVAVGYLAVRAVVMPISDGSIHVPVTDHALAVLETIGRFVEITVAPHDLSLQRAIVHAHHYAMIHDMRYVALGGAAIVVLAGAALALRRRWPAASLGLGFYLATLLPTSNIKYVGLLSLMNERFLYLPVLGIALVIGAALAAAGPDNRRRGYALAAACAIAFAAISASRSEDFGNEEALWLHELELHPDNQQARQFVLQQAIDRRQFKHALEILGDMNRAAAQYDPEADVQLTIASNAVFALAQLTPDHDVASLRALDRFVEDLIDRKGPIARLAVGGVVLAVGVKPKAYGFALPAYLPSLLAYRSDFASRLGDDAAAVRFAAQSRAKCPLCADGLFADALARARAEQFDAALAILRSPDLDATKAAGLRDEIEKAKAAWQEARTATGPAQLDARAQELAALGLWGRAYDTLAPYESDLLQAPKLARAFAELAYRAGEPAVARQVLAAVVPPDQASTYLAAWADAMGWSAAQGPASRSNMSQ